MTTIDGARKLGEFVRRLRLSQGLTVRGLAAKAGIDATGLSRLERGDHLSHNQRTLQGLARALGVDVEDLYLEAGYTDGQRLPGLAPYLRAKYDLPHEAVEQLAAYFDFVNTKYAGGQEGGGHDERHP